VDDSKILDKIGGEVDMKDLDKAGCGSPNDATRQAKHYIFRWKESGICVIPSRSRTAEECWDFALENLRPAIGRRESGRKIVREFGEVIPDDE
jgi:hypothetical protein